MTKLSQKKNNSKKFLHSYLLVLIHTALSNFFTILKSYQNVVFFTCLCQKQI